MNKLLLLPAFLPALLWAHPGHPGPAGHGDLTHALIGLAAALPVLMTTWLLLRARNRRLAKQTVTPEKPHG